LQAKSPKGKAEVLAALPEELKENFVLVKRSRSRQRGTAQLPRVIHFSKSTDLVVTSSGHDYSANRAGLDLEVMELDKTTGKWIFSTIAFDQSGLMGVRKDIPMCMNCHGDIPRPIWGDYLHWTFTYGSSPSMPEKMEGQELADFTAFMAIASTHEGYKHLNLNFQGDHFYLAKTTYGQPNTVFTARLGVRVAEALAKRASFAPDHSRNAGAFAAAALSCPIPSNVEKRVEASYTARVKTDAAFAALWSSSIKPSDTASLAARLLDLDPTVDFELTEFPEISAKQVSLDLTDQWNSGSDYLPALLAFKFFHEFWKADPQTQTTFASVRTAIETLERESFGATNSGLASLDEASTATQYQNSLFPYLHTNVWKDAALKRATCDTLIKHAM
ncbi:MAG: hypothetical protein AAB250_00465, partial [Bdellovibrionota bacterium]